MSNGRATPVLPYPATQEKGIKFKKETLLSKFQRVKRRVLFASSPSDSLANPSISDTSRDSDGITQIAIDIERERKLEDHLDDWEIDQIVVEGVTHDGTTNPHKSVSDSAEPNRNGIDPSELAESLLWIKPVYTLKGLYEIGSLILTNFFSPRFVEPAVEDSFQKERWYNTKFLAWLATGFMLLNWMLYLIFNHSVDLYEKIAYYGIATVLTLPLPFMVGLDFPRRAKTQVFFQIWLMLSTWFWPISESIQMKVCGYFPDHHVCPGNKDFLFMMTYSVAMPALVLFSFNQKRLYATIGGTVQFVLIAILLLPEQRAFVRNEISYFLFTVFFVVLHYYQEQIDRRMFVLRAQLKTSFKAQQKAQMSEKIANNSKRRFVSYIFHEVRVPLNSAMLAFQNLQANNAFKYCEVDQSVEIHALEGSLAMMQKVLNDVLDLQRMDSGKFESSPMPFPFHRTLESMLGTLRVAAAAKNLGLNIDLDPEVDKQLLPEARTDPQGVWVVGDAMRLRQVLSNLTSNAVKFTPQGGGSITVKTKLIAPKPPDSVTPEKDKEDKERHTLAFVQSTGPSSLALSRDVLPAYHRHSSDESSVNSDNSITVRIEVTDSGPGIRPSDLQDSRLFSPFAQTRLGVSHADKGSGLGLAIVRQIVTLSGGRLGVISAKNRGATFWVEFAYRLASNAEIEDHKAHLPSPDMQLLAYSAPQSDDPRPPLPSDRGSTIAPSVPNSQLPTPADQNTPNPIETLNIQQEVIGIMAQQGTGSDDTVMPIASSSASGPSPPPPPLVKSHSEPQKQSPVEEKVPLEIEQSLRVLVVDDDPLTRTLMTRMLSRLGCQVQTLDDGMQFLECLLGDGTPERPPQYFDLVSLDNAMPVMTGQEAIKRLRSLGRRDFVVGVTGNALKSDQSAYLKAGADDILTKPVMLKNLKTILQTALQRRSRLADSITTS